MKNEVLKEIQESPTKFLRAMRDEQGREWIITIIKNPKSKEEMHFQTPFLIPGRAVPALRQIEAELEAATWPV